jgi:hypothetical protein
MRTKDQILLEEAYKEIYLKENIDNTYKYHEEGEYVPEEIDVSEDVPDGGVEIDRNTPLSFFEKGVPKNVFFKDIYPNQIVKLYFDGYIFTQGTILNTKTQKSLLDTKISLKNLNHYFHSRRNEKHTGYNDITFLVASSKFDPTDTEQPDEDRWLDSAYEDRYSESFIHGIQPISEAKKKSVNPYAVCTATVGRKDEEKYKSCKKKVSAGAKKSGKKVTNKPVKKK